MTYLCVPIKIEDLNVSVFNMITGINESKTSTKHISCQCKCRLDGKNVIRINGGIMINVDVSVKNVIYVKKITFGILLHGIVKMENFLTSIMDDSAIICDEVIDAEAELYDTKLSPKEDEETIFNEKKQTSKRKISIFYLSYAKIFLFTILDM